ncbi:glutaredoxin-related protein [Thermococcus kodakarensis KOD1]|uniref:Glutaredoxin-related protein n=1 Tax=Thermococcus kodakarensis (strain ATCC BAA-918 / JCM 12380 / KOD1) TaxID=69014 RepID=Q5JGG9_THEKO|nr:glutaredoxin-related protein [Thermococcus kodakarensis KOD1]
MKKTGILLMLLVLVGFASACLSSDSNTSSQTSTESPKYVDVNGTRIYLDQIHFYMYGMKTCPHCRHMKEWIPEEFGADSLTYYELVNDETNSELFGQLAQLTGITGVPAIAITYNGTIQAIFEGEFNVSATPEIVATAMNANGVILFIGGEWYLLARDNPRSETLIDALQTIFVEHESVDVQSVLTKLKSNSTG